MKVRGVKTTRYFSGFCNQLNHLIHGIIRSVADGIDVMVVEDFKLQIHCEHYCPLGDIIDLCALNEYLRAEYGLTVVTASSFRVEIESASYGTMARMLDVRKPLMDKCYQEESGRFYLDESFHMNELAYDVAPNMGKSLRVVYGVGDYKVSKIYGGEQVHIDFAMDVRALPFILYESISESRVWHESLMKKLPLHPSFYTEASQIKVQQPVHVLHLRTEDDAIQHWSLQNKMTPDEFEIALSNRYIEVLMDHSHVRDGTLLVLSYREDGIVFDWLEENKFNYIHLKKDKNRGREWNAARDLTIGESLGNGILIGVLDYYRMQGSTFTHYLMKRMHPLYTVLIDIERIRELPVVF